MNTPEQKRASHLREQVVVLLALGHTDESIVGYFDDLFRGKGERNRLDAHMLEKWRVKYDWTPDHIAELSRIAREKGADSLAVMEKAGALATGNHPYQDIRRHTTAGIAEHIREMSNEDKFEKIDKIRKWWDDFVIPTEGFDDDRKRKDEPPARSPIAAMYNTKITVNPAREENGTRDAQGEIIENRQENTENP